MNNDAIRIDPETGLKVVRYASGQSQREESPVPATACWKTRRFLRCPRQPPGAAFNAEEQAKYREFKEARAGRGRLHVARGRILRRTSRTSTPRTPVQRDPLTDECEILVVGAGFAGLLLWYRLDAKPGSRTSASARRAATSAARGTGTGTPALRATSRATAISRCSRRWATSPP